MRSNTFNNVIPFRHEKDGKEIATQEFIDRLMSILLPLAEVADAYDLNLLEGEATKFWGNKMQFQNHTPPEKIELVVDKHKRCYISLKDCIRARNILKYYGK